MDLITLLVVVIIIGILFYVLSILPIPQPFKNIAYCVLGLIAVVWLLGLIGVVPGIRLNR